MEEDVVQRLAAAFRCTDEHSQILSRRLLADELVEAFRPKRRVSILAGALGSGDSVGISRHLVPESSRGPLSRASRASSAGIDRDLDLMR